MPRLHSDVPKSSRRDGRSPHLYRREETVGGLLTTPGHLHEPPLHWQSKLVLLLVLPAAATWLTVLLLRVTPAGTLLSVTLQSAAPMLLPGIVLAALVWIARAATPGGAMTGGLLMACFCLTTPGWRSSAWALLAMLVLTLGATRIGRARKQHLGTAESRHGRSAAQVVANLGIAALAGIAGNVHGQQVALAVLLGALAESAADTLASELGQVAGGTPRMITTLRPVPPGTDGGITLAGTAIGALGGALVVGVGVVVLQLPALVAVVATGAAVIGLLFDSLLGATLERAGWLNNDAVNFLSTLAAALVALAAAEFAR
jgi:uncharacterized protein (TIGR00297 family)